MKILEEFDKAIVDAELAKGEVKNGYKPEGVKKTYDNYLDNASWEALKNDMNEDHARQYDAGSGGELEEKDGKPPKMASFASSSQMIYKLSKEIPGFCFEEKLPTTVGGTANMDGYLEKAGNYVFVEAKCREPYGHKALQDIKQAYKPVYHWLCDKMPQVFDCVMEDYADEKKGLMRVAFFCKNESVSYFDIKQMICHLLGVATKFLKPLDKKGTQWLTVDKIRFLYLLYDPSQLSLEEEAKTVILEIYNDTCWAASDFAFKEMFAQVVDYLVALRKEKNKPVPDETYLRNLKAVFEFKLCSQNDYCDLL